MDNSLPDGSGKTGIEQIRKFEGIRSAYLLVENNIDSIPIFSLSGTDSEEIKRQYSGMNVQEFLTKPIYAEELIPIIGKYLK